MVLALLAQTASAGVATTVDSKKLNASHETINKTKVPLYKFIDQSDQGMQWSVANVADVGPALEAASNAVALLHAAHPSAVADAYGNGSMTNIEDTFKLFGGGNLERGCISHQYTTYNAVKKALGDKSSLTVSKIRVRLKFAFPHNAVIIFPTGTDWKKTGIVLDAWKRQKSALDKMVYTFPDWYGLVDAGAKLIGEDE